MGLFDILNGALGGGSSSVKKGPKQKCPSCKSDITLDMERCPKCGVHVSSMFRMKCPKCQTLNDLKAKKCTKCGYDFEAELSRAEKTVYRCPICGYKSESFLTSCPACGTRFV